MNEAMIRNLSWEERVRYGYPLQTEHLEAYIEQQLNLLIDKELEEAATDHEAELEELRAELTQIATPLNVATNALRNCVVIMNRALSEMNHGET